MSTSTAQRGVTLIEVMIALAIVMITATGMVGIHNQGAGMMADARKMTQATAIASDLVEQMASWDYATDLRLVDSGNNADFGDSTHVAQGTSYTAEFREADLARGTWNGIPTAALPVGYERMWNVADTDLDGDGTNDAKRIAVIVRWPHGAGFHRVVIVTSKVNPAVYR